jgi:hypothetical protein
MIKKTNISNKDGLKLLEKENCFLKSKTNFSVYKKIVARKAFVRRISEKGIQRGKISGRSSRNTRKAF